MKPTFEIDFLDHVAIRVKDMARSILWYEEVLGLKKYQLEKFGPYPIFMLAKKTGVALFPANADDPQIPSSSRNVKIDHFAFNVDKENFRKAIKKFEALGQAFELQDHHYFHSVYLRVKH